MCACIKQISVNNFNWDTSFILFKFKFIFNLVCTECCHGGAKKKKQLQSIKRKQCGAREFARVFQVDETQIQTILKNVHGILKQFKDKDPGQHKRKIRKTGNEEINKLTWEWFKDVTACRLPVSGPLLQERALKFATDLVNNDFKASNGWLDSFCWRHNIAFVTRCGKSGNVDNAIVDDWKQKLPSLLEGYDPKDVFNMDKKGLFFQQSEKYFFKTLSERREKCRGGRKVKLRMAVSLCSSVLGEKVKPLVIWKYTNTRCFKGIQKD